MAPSASDDARARQAAPAPRRGSARSGRAPRARRVAGRRAADGGSDVDAAQREPVVARDARRLAGEPRAVERGVEEVARAIAGEHAPRAVRAVRAGREADDDEARAGIAEAGDRAAPVVSAR